MVCIVSFQISKLRNVESIYYRKKFFWGILNHENIFTQKKLKHENFQIHGTYACVYTYIYNVYFTKPYYQGCQHHNNICMLRHWVLSQQGNTHILQDVVYFD